jgi:hypothetical protein
VIQTFDPRRLEAFEQMLAQPQPRGLPRGGHVYRWAGEPDRRTTRLPGIIMGWLQRRHLEVDAEEPLTGQARTYRRARRPVRPLNSRLHILRPTGTS